MAGSIFVPNAQALSEGASFFKGIIVGCGEAGAMVIAHVLKGTPLSASDLTNLIQSAANANQLSGAGYGQTAQNVQWDLAQYGINSNVVGWDKTNTNAMLNDIVNALQQGKPVELGVSNGSALMSESSTLRGHYVDIVGLSGGFFTTADPNSPQSKSGQFTVNTWQQLLNSDPFALIVPSGTGPGSTTQDPGGVQLPSNPLDIAGAINALGGNIASSISAGIASPFKQVGITSLQDFGWRTVLIVMALIFLVFGIVAIVVDFGKQQVQNAAPIAAAAL